MTGRKRKTDSEFQRFMAALGMPDPDGELPEDVNAHRWVPASVLLATVWTDVPTDQIACIGVGVKDSGALWREMHAGGLLGTATSADECPAEPWCAARIDSPGDLEAMTWLGDFERCLAWAWIEMQEG